ncbi:MAG: amino acid adenylation domain-containing protein [Atopobiaceae bacterium]|nr:amino acid adenylation domain-containing protein [Atopobiaceae bacterium]
MFGSEYLDAIEEQVRLVPDGVVFQNSAGERLTYGELGAWSNALACWLADAGNVPSGVPVVLYGHKSPFMLVSMIACAKAGHPYAPVDTVYPTDRIRRIIDQIVTHAGGTLFVDTTASQTSVVDGVPVLGLDRLASLCTAQVDEQAVLNLPGKARDDTFYILFTSGSTGEPKGVEITTECVDEFSRWLLTDYVFEEDGHRVWFNRTPYTFDVSITDMVCGTTRGDTTFALEAEAEGSIPRMFEALAKSEATDWVSTPSSVEQCLADASFDATLMPRLKRMLLAGETLRPATVREVKRRFPGIHVYNGYGPTESTDLVTLCEITDEMLADDLALPIGYAKRGSELVVLDPQTLERKQTGEAGELFIVGNTVAKGYWGRPDLTQAAFHACPESITQGRRSYRTGDEVTYGADGLIYFHGRLDLQVKLHGFRIELGDIEAQLCASPLVHMACVLPVWRDGAIHHLMACVVPSDQATERGLKLTRSIKAQVRDALPAYMIPRTFKYLDEMPLNANGKADRKALATLMEA